MFIVFVTREFSKFDRLSFDTLFVQIGATVESSPPPICSPGKVLKYLYNIDWH